VEGFAYRLAFDIDATMLVCIVCGQAGCCLLSDLRAGIWLDAELQEFDAGIAWIDVVVVHDVDAASVVRWSSIRAIYWRSTGLGSDLWDVVGDSETAGGDNEVAVFDAVMVPTREDMADSETVDEVVTLADFPRIDILVVDQPLEMARLEYFFARLRDLTD
jgi:hypothetical protein